MWLDSGYGGHLSCNRVTMASKDTQNKLYQRSLVIIMNEINSWQPNINLWFMIQQLYMVIPWKQNNLICCKFHIHYYFFIFKTQAVGYIEGSRVIFSQSFSSSHPLVRQNQGSVKADWQRLGSRREIIKWFENHFAHLMTA